jgi:hypothetical protein
MGRIVFWDQLRGSEKDELKFGDVPVVNKDFEKVFIEGAEIMPIMPRNFQRNRVPRLPLFNKPKTKFEKEVAKEAT